MRRIFIYTLLLIVLSVISLFIGVKDITFQDILSWEEDKTALFFISRVPRTVSLVLAGIGMSVSGLIMQQITQNKFVSPATAGTLEAAKMGLLAALFLLPHAGGLSKMLFAFGCTFLASVAFLKIAGRLRYRNIIFVPIIGIVFGNILNAISTFFAYKYNIVQNANAWMLGDFSGVLQGRYEMIYLSIPAVLITYLYASRFMAAGMGEQFSKNIGINYQSIVYTGIFCVCLTVSVVVITVGAIPFIGLVVPNMVSLRFGDNLRKTLPITAIWGALFLMACDITGRVIIYPYEIPIGMVVGLAGGVLFFLLLSRIKK